MKHPILCLPLLLASSSTVVFAVDAGPKRPNVIVIMTDDQGYGEFSCHGNPITKTPHIDRLAENAIRLTDFHVAPMCTPTRGQLLTGVDAFRNRASNVSSGRTLLRADLKTIADFYRQGGYATGIFGKWHLGDNYPFRPEDRGFDEAIWFPSSHINSVPDFWDNDYFDDTYIHNGRRQKFDGYCTDVFFAQAIKWMKAVRQDKPFFTYIALNAAHWPWFVPDHYRQPIRDTLDANADVARNLDAKRREDLVSFLAMGANIDDNIGRLDQFLETNGLLNDTIVIFLTDNGSTMGQDYYNAGMRGKKTQLWEGGHRVPCFIRWPGGNIGPARDIGELCQVQDLLPTLADLSGIELETETLDGVSLAPLLTGGSTPKLADRMLVINYSRMPAFKVRYTEGNPAIPQRDGAGVLWRKWRYLENRELYHVGNDPHQNHNVASAHPEVVAKMRHHLQQWWDGVKDDVMVPERVVIGSNRENPMLLTACEWLDVFVDQQIQVRRAVRKNGIWHLRVDQSGEYRIELRRWPRETARRLSEGAPRIAVTDGTFVEGQVLPIATATLRVGDQVKHLTPQPDEQSFVTKLTLPEGPIEMSSAFLDSNGDEICGAYYVYVRRENHQTPR